jgi:hypothetical protein
LHREYRRKVRTIARGMETLWYKRQLLDPFRHGAFAWKLWSHKVCRWLLPWSALPAAAGLVLLATVYEWALVTTLVAAAVAASGAIAWVWQGRHGRLPRLLGLLAFTIVAHGAVLHATIKALRNEKAPTWEPTRREVKAGSS